MPNDENPRDVFDESIEEVSVSDDVEGIDVASALSSEDADGIDVADDEASGSIESDEAEASEPDPDIDVAAAAQDAFGEGAIIPAVPIITPEKAEDAGGSDIAETDEAETDLESQGLIALKKLEERRRRKRRNRIIRIAIIAAVAVAALVIWLMRDTLFAPPEEEYVPETYVVARQDFATTVQGSGSLKSGKTVVVTPEVDGIIEEVDVVEGQYVEEGDVLVTLRNTDLDKAVSEAADQVNSASADVYNAQATVYDLQQAYENAVNEYNWAIEQNALDESAARVAGDEAFEQAYEAAVAKIPKDATEKERKRLLAAAEETAQQAYQKAYDSVPITEVPDLDEASYISEIDSAQSSVSSAQSALNTAQSDYNQAVEQADKRIVRAPISGTVLALEAVPGAATGGAEGGTSKSVGSLMQISDLTKMKVNIEVNEVDISTVQEGQRAQVTFSALPDLELEATVSSIASVATGSGEGDGGGFGGVASFTVSLDIAEPDDRLKLGMTASVRIFTQDEQDVLVVPVSALEDDGESVYVEVVTDEETMATEQRKVKVGARSSSQAVIKKGLKEGEMILAEVAGPLMDEGDIDEGDLEEMAAMAASISDTAA